MNVKLYRLFDQAVTLQPAAEGQTWRMSHPALDSEPLYAHAAQQGWNLLCPLAFATTWNGGSRPEDIEIRLEGASVDGASSAPAFVQSNLGEGLLTFYPGYQFKTEGAYVLWLRGPVNAPKDGLYPLESMVDASLGNAGPQVRLLQRLPGLQCAGLSLCRFRRHR
jgi:hypothetical protein